MRRHTEPCLSPWPLHRRDFLRDLLLKIVCTSSIFIGLIITIFKTITLCGPQFIRELYGHGILIRLRWGSSTRSHRFEQVVQLPDRLLFLSLDTATAPATRSIEAAPQTRSYQYVNLFDSNSRVAEAWTALQKVQEQVHGAHSATLQHDARLTLSISLSA